MPPWGKPGWCHGKDSSTSPTVWYMGSLVSMRFRCLHSLFASLNLQIYIKNTINNVPCKITKKFHFAVGNDARARSYENWNQVCMTLLRMAFIPGLGSQWRWKTRTPFLNTVKWLPHNHVVTWTRKAACLNHSVKLFTGAFKSCVGLVCALVICIELIRLSTDSAFVCVPSTAHTCSVKSRKISRKHSP